jgi:hypothetical protein
MRNIGNLLIESLRADLPERVPCGQAASLASETTQTANMSWCGYRPPPPRPLLLARATHGAGVICPELSRQFLHPQKRTLENSITSQVSNVIGSRIQNQPVTERSCRRAISVATEGHLLT